MFQLTSITIATLTVALQSNSSKASTWFCNIGIVLRSLSPFISLSAPPSFLQQYRHVSHFTILLHDHWPSLHFAEVHGSSPVGCRLLTQVFSISSDERRHVISCNIWSNIYPPKFERADEKTKQHKQYSILPRIGPVLPPPLCSTNNNNDHSYEILETLNKSEVIWVVGHTWTKTFLLFT